MSAREFWALDDFERDLWLERHRQAQRQCPHCGRDAAVCSDPDRPWYPQRVTCYATRDAEAARRKYAELHSEESGRVFHEGNERSWVAKRDDAHPYHFSDGVTVIVTETDVNPDDKFLSGGEPVGHED